MEFGRVGSLHACLAVAVDNLQERGERDIAAREDDTDPIETRSRSACGRILDDS